MLLSEILKEAKLCKDFRIENEKPFKYLGLTSYGSDEDSLSFLDDEKYIGDIGDNVTMLLVNEELSSKLKGRSFGLCITDEPRMLFFKLHNYLKDNDEYRRKKFKTIIGENCTISPLAYIAENNVIIGDNNVIEEFASVKENTVTEDNVIIRSGAKIGGHGFEFKRYDGGIMSVEHLGGVVLKKNSEIQYNTCVDRGIYPWDDTVIGENSKVDNLVHVGHGAKVDKNNLVVALSGIGGRVKIEEDCWIGFHSVMRNGITIGNGARVNMGAVVTKDVEDNASVTGNFAIEHKKFLRNLKEANRE